LVSGKNVEGGQHYATFFGSRIRARAVPVVADKRTSKDTAHLVTKNKYKDFQIYAEFWASDDANSSILIRCMDPKSIGARTYYFTEVNPMPKAGGKWKTFEITAKGRHITVLLNRQKTAELHNGLFEEGPFTLQHGEGVIRWRKVAVKPL
jgi:3-keto-disaccharide hydrolase